MPYRIQEEQESTVLELHGDVTAREVGELTRSLGASLRGERDVVVRTHGLQDIDTCVLQTLISLRKTASSMTFHDPSETFLKAVNRCSLRRELLAGGPEAA